MLMIPEWEDQAFLWNADNFAHVETAEIYWHVQN